MRKTITFIILLAALLCHAQTGTWRAYMAYHDVTEIEKAGNMIYVLASQNLFSYNQNDQSLQTYDKVNALSDTQIAHIKWCQAAHRLLIVYTNYNIDLLNDNGTVTNIAAYYNKAMTDDKTVNSVNIDGRYAYLSTSFGILKLNMANATISDTYNLGFNVDYSYVSNGFLYAASQQRGLYRASTATNLLDPNNWSRVREYTPQTTTLDPELLELVGTLKPGGPKYDYFHDMKLIDGTLYTCGGFFASGLSYYRPGTVQVLANDEWQIYQDNIRSITGYNYDNVNSLDVDPTIPNHVYASGKCGLYEFNNGQLTAYYNRDNSPLQGAIDGARELPNDFVLVHAVKFDAQGNLWVFNSQARTNSILRLSKDHEWTAYDLPALMGPTNSMSNMVLPFIDASGNLWFTNNHSGDPALVSFDGESTVKYSNFVNQDGTNVIVHFARCARKDRDGNIWLCTDVGPLMLRKEDIGNNAAPFQQIKVPRNDGTNYADYLLANVDISFVAIDAGNRKWFGTNEHGVYLISDDNLTQISHFTAENSPLLSNHIESIAINEQTGEVFFGTEKGLCSYMSGITSTNDEMTKDNVYAYPNPVRPDYTGLISVVGLSYNAEVKITTVSGKLVAEGRSNGGTFTWDGCDRDGKRVASGIYLVHTSTEEGKKGTVCKIAIVR